MKITSSEFMQHADAALADTDKAQRRDLLGLFMPLARDAAAARYGDFEALRAHLKQVRRHTMAHLEHYLTRFEETALRNGNQVHFAATPEELNSTVLSICRAHGARRVAKGKSMVTEETALNDHLLKAGLEVIETDLGEYIIQQAGETPSHIVGPALHKSLADIRQLFLDRHPLGERPLKRVEDIVSEARGILREQFLQAEVGVIGANALIAEDGTTMLVTNEGNGDLCANLPPVVIVCTTLERILPRAEDAMALQRLLVRSATGQPHTCYTSFYSGPRREEDVDGPLETHIILLDNKRTELLASDYSEILDCIRCGACLNHCPIYVAVGGHAYGWVYPGPMGSVLTPLLTSLEQSNALPNACTSCGRCAEICPANIPLPDLLRDLRQEENQRQLNSPRLRRGLRLHAWLLCHPALYQRLTGWTMPVLAWLGRRRGGLHKLPFAAGWTGTRDFPAPEGGTFMRQYRKRGRGRRRRG
ncbi:lactate utilization protein B [Haliea sp.]